LSKASSNVNAMDKGTRLERSILQVPLSTIVGESPMQPRVTTFDPDVYEEDAELLNSIKKFGVLEPIMICRESDSGEKRVYNIVFGHRRMAAALMAGHKTIPAIVAKSGDNVHLLTLAENTGGRSLTAYERAVGLIRWKESNAGITQVKLAKDTGVSQGTISNLLAAYEASTPALRGLFASGMAARAVIELQDTFARLSEKKQVELAGQLDGATKREVQYIKELLDQGISPETAVDTIGTSHASATEENSTKTSLEDEDQLRAVAELTGASLRSVKNLARKAGAQGAGAEALQLACAYVARGGNSRNALPIASEMAKDGKINRLLGKINRLLAQSLRIERRARKVIEKTRDEKASNFLSTVFFGGGG
jgi:ParB/RepB/Spo0J family partition protein